MTDRRCVVIVPVATSTEIECERGLDELARRGYTVWRRSCHVAIDMGRSQMASEALAAGFDEQMWIDADIGFSADDVDRLRQHRESFVCAIYPKRGPAELACQTLQGTTEIVFGEMGPCLVELSHVGMGFCLIRREVFDDVRTKHGLATCGKRSKTPWVPYFLPMVKPMTDDPDDNWYLAEDYAFCERARAAGHPVYADTRIRLFHIGRKALSWEDATGPRERYENVKMLLR
jgi:hypothetical protein